MADTRIFVQRQSWVRYQWCNIANGHLLARTEIARFRNDLRSAFSDSRYKVSDIAEWTGSSTNFRGAAFILRDNNFNHEYIFMFRYNTASDSEYWFLAYQYATINNYFQYTSSSSTALNISNTLGGVSMGYNHDCSSGTGATYGMGFSDTTNLTYAGGDFSAPAANPYSDLSSFMPADRIKSFHFGSAAMGTQPNKTSVLYDPDIGVFSNMGQYGGDCATNYAWIAGQIFPENSDGGVLSATDTNLRGALFINQSGAGSSSMGGTNSSVKFCCQFIRENGTIENAGTYTNVLGNYTRENYRTAGQIDYRKLRIEVTGYAKGYINPAIVCEALPTNDEAFRFFRFTIPGHDNKPLIRNHVNLCMMYKEGVPFFTHLPDKVEWTG